MAGVFWIFEPIPIYATSLLVIFLQVLSLSDQGLIDLSQSGYEVESYKTFYSTLANPIIILFLGGFSLATAAVKYGIDKSLTRLLIKPFGSNPRMVCLGMMLSTALLSNCHGAKTRRRIQKVYRVVYPRCSKYRWYSDPYWYSTECDRSDCAARTGYQYYLLYLDAAVHTSGDRDVTHFVAYPPVAISSNGEVSPAGFFGKIRAL
jgi:di/tricarboxylate transporter